MVSAVDSKFSTIYRIYLPLNYIPCLYLVKCFFPDEQYINIAYPVIVLGFHGVISSFQLWDISATHQHSVTLTGEEESGNLQAICM